MTLTVRKNVLVVGRMYITLKFIQKEYKVNPIQTGFNITVIHLPSLIIYIYFMVASVIISVRLSKKIYLHVIVLHYQIAHLLSKFFLV